MPSRTSSVSPTPSVVGGTTSARALYSTARQEHHVGTDRTRFRLHLIAGDSHPSPYNLALTTGATALALKAVQFDAGILRRVGRTHVRGARESWVGVLRRLNRLCGPDEVPAAVDAILAGGPPGEREGPPLWDGHAGDRIADEIVAWLAGRA